MRTTTGARRWRSCWSDPVPAAYVRFVRGMAMGTIENSDPLPRAWMARFGRTVAEQVLEAVESRMRAPRAPGAEVSLAGVGDRWRGVVCRDSGGT